MSKTSRVVNYDGRYKMSKQIKRMLTQILVTAFIFASGLNATEMAGASNRESLTIGDKRLKLMGEGLLRYWGLKVYKGAFYLEEGCTVEEALSDRAKRLEVNYLRPIQGKDFGPATDKSIEKNVDKQTFERLRPKIDYHNSLYEDVGPGDQYSLTYIPGRGTELALNGEPKGVIEGADFAAALFSIWLGPEPINREFKKQILGL